MDGSYENQFDENTPGARQLTKGQRRILGVLVEKAFTTPDQYPLTLKAVTTGANQKSNRDPITNFTEGAVWEILDELREMGLIAVVHPESGRTERFRHYMRKRYPFNEPQLAIMTELLLRGRQQLGELRARASRMVAIESLDELRRELTALQNQGFIQSNGPLERRGIDVNHNMHADGEQGKLEPASAIVESPQAVSHSSMPVTHVEQASAPSEEMESLRDQTSALKLEIESLRQALAELRDDFDELRRSLGA